MNITQTTPRMTTAPPSRTCRVRVIAQQTAGGAAGACRMVVSVPSLSASYTFPDAIFVDVSGVQKSVIGPGSGSISGSPTSCKRTIVGNP